MPCFLHLGFLGQNFVGDFYAGVVIAKNCDICEFSLIHFQQLNAIIILQLQQIKYGGNILKWDDYA
jgi:hypothetical protein